MIFILCNIYYIYLYFVLNQIFILKRTIYRRNFPVPINVLVATIIYRVSSWFYTKTSYKIQLEYLHKHLYIFKNISQILQRLNVPLIL